MNALERKLAENRQAWLDYSQAHPLTPLEIERRQWQEQLAKGRQTAEGFKVLSFVFGSILVLQIASWLFNPEISKWLIEDENAVMWRKTQPFHKTQEQKLKWHKDGDLEGWAYREGEGWCFVRFGDD